MSPTPHHPDSIRLVIKSRVTTLGGVPAACRVVTKFWGLVRDLFSKMLASFRSLMERLRGDDVSGEGSLPDMELTAPVSTADPHVVVEQPVSIASGGLLTWHNVNSRGQLEGGVQPGVTLAGCSAGQPGN